MRLATHYLKEHDNEVDETTANAAIRIEVNKNFIAAIDFDIFMDTIIMIDSAIHQPAPVDHGAMEPPFGMRARVQQHKASIFDTGITVFIKAVLEERDPQIEFKSIIDNIMKQTYCGIQYVESILHTSERGRILPPRLPLSPR